MNRKDIIEQLTLYELEFLLENSDKHTLLEVAEFFANGGFNVYTDQQLKNKLNDITDSIETIFSDEEKA